MSTHHRQYVSHPLLEDKKAAKVLQALIDLDPSGERTDQVLRATLDQLYDGRNTGRFRPEQLHKTEKTHMGTLVEINMQREFQFKDGESLDYYIAGTEVDCKYSMKMLGWMIPPEAMGRLCLLITADDLESTWSMGLVRVSEELLSSGQNRDRKRTISSEMARKIYWLFKTAHLPENILLHLDPATTRRIMSHRSGAARIRELCRLVHGRTIGRTTVETVAQQEDCMKRLRANGGAREPLSKEGIVILVGKYSKQQLVAESLGLPVPGPDEAVCARLARAHAPEGACIDGEWWRIAEPGDPVEQVPLVSGQ